MALAAIDTRVAYICRRIREVLAEFLAQDVTAAEQAGSRPTDFIRFAAQWSFLVPHDAAARAVLIHLLQQRHGLNFAGLSPLRSPCGVDATEVRAIYRHLYGSEIEAYAEAPLAADEMSDSLDLAAGWLSLGRGEVLCRQGEPADHLYYLASGRLSVAFHGEHGAERQVGEVSPGEYVGEMGVLTGDPRSATVHALRDSELLVLDRAAFDAIQTPETLRHLTRQLIIRLRRTLQGQEQRRRVSTITVVGATADTRVDAFCDALQISLRHHGTVAYLNSRHLERQLSIVPEEADSPTVAEWLSRQEMEHSLVLYRADVEATAWSRRCLRQADLILLIVDRDTPTLGAAAEQLVLTGSTETDAARCEVVLLGQDSATHEARRWTSQPSVRRVYHVDPSDRADIDRLARCIVGCAIGLVLGGGAARGYAHIGVLRALEEARIPVDVIGGTSVGAIVAAAHALGWGAEAMLERLCIPERIKFDFSFPALALTRGARLRNWLEGWLGDRDIEDLHIPYFCASSNLTRAVVKVHGSGPLLRALMATNAGPAILPPVVDNGDLLVDGALLANVPTQAMRDLPEVGPILAVDVSPHVDLASNDDYGLALSGWRVLRSWLTPGRKRMRVPSIFSIQVRSQLLASLAQRKQVVYGPYDLLLQMDLEEFSYLDYGRIREIGNAGYQQAVPQIATWKDQALAAISR
ncbi:MAG: patatin-like phospholipase family protein [Chloroflexota bacterium]